VTPIGINHAIAGRDDLTPQTHSRQAKAKLLIALIHRDACDRFGICHAAPRLAAWVGYALQSRTYRWSDV